MATGQMPDAVVAVTLAAQAQAVASLAGQRARSAAPVGAEGADRAGSGGTISTPPVQAPMIASFSPPLGKLTADESKSIMASTKGFEASMRKLRKCNTKWTRAKMICRSLPKTPQARGTRQAFAF